jgi:hypothetical protein
MYGLRCGSDEASKPPVTRATASLERLFVKSISNIINAIKDKGLLKHYLPRYFGKFCADKSNSGNHRPKLIQKRARNLLKNESLLEIDFRKV